MSSKKNDNKTGITTDIAQGTTYEPISQKNIRIHNEEPQGIIDKWYSSMDEEKSPDSQDINEGLKYTSPLNQDRLSTNTVHLSEKKNYAKTKKRSKKPIAASIPTVPDASAQTKQSPIVELQSTINGIAQESPTLQKHNVAEHSYDSQYIQNVFKDPMNPVTEIMFINNFFQCKQQVEESSRLEDELYNLKTQAELIDPQHRKDSGYDKMLPKIQDIQDTFYRELDNIIKTFKSITPKATDQLSSINNNTRNSIEGIAKSLAEERKVPKQESTQAEITKHKRKKPAKRTKKEDLWIAAKEPESSTDTAPVVNDHDTTKVLDQLKPTISKEEPGFNFSWMDNNEPNKQEKQGFNLWQLIKNFFTSLFSPLLSNKTPIPDNKIHLDYNELPANAKLLDNPGQEE